MVSLWAIPLKSRVGSKVGFHIKRGGIRSRSSAHFLFLFREVGPYLGSGAATTVVVFGKALSRAFLDEELVFIETARIMHGVVYHLGNWNMCNNYDYL